MSDVLIPEFTLGDRLAKARDAAGISVTEMARRLGVVRNTIGNWEHDRVEPSGSVVIAYSTITGVPDWWLVNGGREPSEAALDRRRRRRVVTQR